jgi:quercetin dioxygenase-like cupin family protein
MTVTIPTEKAAGHYTVIEMKHPPLVGPALHIHPTHPETFCILEGHYTFFRDKEIIEAKSGDYVSILPGIPHRYKVGNEGGRVIVLSPPTLEKYFRSVSERIASGGITPEEEKDIASRYGQHFLDMSAHW